MVKMIHAQFGNEMWVAENRVEEYKAAGHKLAVSATKPAEKSKKTEKKTKK